MSELIPPPSDWKFRLNLDAATLTSQLTLDCYGDTRTLKVKRAPVTNVNRLPYGVPKINGVSDPSFRWHWGSGIGGTTFNAHSYPEHRHSYDSLIWDTSNQTFADPAKKDHNDNFYAWGQEVLVIRDGDVIFANASFEDNFGTTAWMASSIASATGVLVAQGSWRAITEKSLKPSAGK